ncbi:MAG: S41 family peptidase [Flavobacteriaceae bacterium]|nr:S41 family peptidase [Flavobacteriaceae bacterium]
MKLLKSLSTAAIILLLLLPTKSLAQEIDRGLTPQQTKNVIDSIGVRLNRNYVFPKVASKMANKLKENEKKGAYKSITDPFQFADILTRDLQAVSNDLHLRVMFNPEQIAERDQTVSPADSTRYMNNYMRRLQRDNFGFKQVEILDGNIGYLDLRSFADTQFAGETATAAMNFLSNADAIIIDLRANGGGSPQMIQLTSSYLFEGRVHLNNFYMRPNNDTLQTWTLPYVPGKRNPNADVYVLTSGSTFSAAEEFSYNLKNLERATLIGETTGGGAHPGGTQPINDRFMIWLPTGRAISPITNTNWEGVGVIPHIAVPAADALETAKLKALETLRDKINDEEMAHFYNWSIKAIKAEKNPVKVDIATLKKYAGKYGPRVVRFENNQLYYQRAKGRKYSLVPLSNDEFMLDGLSDFRIQFLSENNKVVALQGNYQGGNTDKNMRED